MWKLKWISLRRLILSCVVSECFKQIVSKRLFCFDEESEQRREETREKDKVRGKMLSIVV
jgi:hypothetical protein